MPRLRRGRGQGLALGLGLTAAFTAALAPLRGDITTATPALLLLVPVVMAALVGGRGAAVVTAGTGTLAFNLVFIRPYWTLNIEIVDDLITFLVFAGVGIAVGTLVALEADRRRVAETRAEELQTMGERLASVLAERERLAEEATRVAVLEQVDAQRAALLRSVSHDLRTPLAVVHAVVSDLRAGTGYDEGTREELLDLVLDETQRLDRLVANLLELSRIEAGALRPERQAVVVGELVGDCTRRLERLFTRSPVRLELSPELPLADADYSQLDQVLTNLLENAARHAPPGTTITVGARADGNAMISVWVDDHGPGVAPEDREHVFEPFWHGEGAASSGVGLAICRALVEAHGGRIGVESPSGGGARFVFTVPVRRG